MGTTYGLHWSVSCVLYMVRKLMETRQPARHRHRDMAASACCVSVSILWGPSLFRVRFLLCVVGIGIVTG